MRKLQKAVFWFTLISFASANTPQKHLTPGISLDGETVRFGSGVSRCVRTAYFKAGLGQGHFAE